MRALKQLLLSALVLLPGLALAQSAADEAGDVSEVDKDAMGPLRERVRPVSGHLFLKQGRFELSPSATLSIKDAFFTKYILGATLTYHPVETVGVGLRFGYAIPTISSSAQICTTEALGLRRGCRAPVDSEVDGIAPGKILLLGGLDGQWAPIYGKIALFAEQFLHFDMYAVGGPAFVQYEGPSSVSKTTFGANVGLGMRFFVNRWLTVRAEGRDLIYAEEVRGTDDGLRNQLFVELGLSMFFPTTFGER